VHYESNIQVIPAFAVGWIRRHGAIDQRDHLVGKPFAFRVAKNGSVFVSWQGRTVTTLNGKAAERFLAQIEGLEGQDAQLVMAKVTGNFKRGNERLSKERGRS
jgi:hypothetical protein